MSADRLNGTVGIATNPSGKHLQNNQKYLTYKKNNLMPKLKINNVDLYYEMEGEGRDTLVFAHSLLFNLRMFDQQVAHFKKDYTCIRYDFPGHGKSESPESGYDLESLAEDLAEFLKTLKVGPCHFIGFSMGGMTGMRAAIKYPHLFKSLVLIDTSSEPEPKKGIVRNKTMLFIAKHFGLKPLSDRVMSMFFGKHFLNDPGRKKIRTQYKTYFEQNNRTGIIKAANGVLTREGITPQLASINLPTTIMVGEEDHLTDLNKARIIQQHIKDSVLSIIPGASHMGPVEEPEFVNNILTTHLQSVSHTDTVKN